MKIEIKLKQLMIEKNITQSELSELTGIRQAYISELVNMKRQSVNLNHLASIIRVLNVRDMNRVLGIIEDHNISVIGTIDN